MTQRLYPPGLRPKSDVDCAELPVRSYYQISNSLLEYFPLFVVENDAYLAALSIVTEYIDSASSEAARRIASADTPSMLERSSFPGSAAKSRPTRLAITTVSLVRNRSS